MEGGRRRPKITQHGEAEEWITCNSTLRNDRLGIFNCSGVYKACISLVADDENAKAGSFPNLG